MELKSKRIIDLIIRYLAENSRTLLKVLITATLIITIIGILSNYRRHFVMYEPVISLAYNFMFIGGAIFTSNIFKEMLSPARAYRFLTLPASTIEKLVFAWILTSPVVILVSFLLFHVIVWLQLSFLVPVFNARYEMLDIINDAHFLQMAKIYMIIQPVFLLGAALFKKANFINTLLFSILSVAAIGLVTLVMVKLMFNVTLDNKDIFNGIVRVSQIDDFFKNDFTRIVKFLFHYVMGPLIMVITYFLIKEKEIV